MDRKARSGTVSVKKGASRSCEPAVAAKELYDAIYDENAALTVFYCSPSYDLERLGSAIHALFGDKAIIGCTTAGEITPLGYLEGSLTGVTIIGAGTRAVTVRMDELQRFELGRGDELADAAIARLEPSGPVTAESSFGFLLVDGLSMQEEALVSSLYRRLGGIQMFGGSAGDGTRFGKTFVYHEGQFRSDCAVFTLVASDAPFVVFKTEHFVPAREKLVVTKADPARRVVTEINGEPAGLEYARAVGLDVTELTPLIFASHPVVVSVGGESFVRSIAKVNADGSLTFFCAIDEGIVLTVAEGIDMVANLASAFQSVRDVIGEATVILGCDCILRFIETDQKGIRDEIGALMRENNVVGFATYGEQFNAMHVNQTFTGVAIGGAAAHG